MCVNVIYTFLKTRILRKTFFLESRFLIFFNFSRKRVCKIIFIRKLEIHLASIKISVIKKIKHVNIIKMYFEKKLEDLGLL